MGKGKSYKIGMSRPVAAIYSYDSAKKEAKYSKAVRLGEAMTGTFTPNYTDASLQGDDHEVDSSNELTSTTIALGVTKLPIKAHEVVFGSTVTGSKVSEKTTDTANDVGLGFMTRQSDGKYTAFIYNKAKFSKGAETYTTKGQSVTYSTPTLNGKAVESDVDSEVRSFEEDLTEEEAWKYITDILGDPDADQSTGTNQETDTNQETGGTTEEE